jgi:hypothetical protein
VITAPVRCSPVQTSVLDRCLADCPACAENLLVPTRAGPFPARTAVLSLVMTVVVITAKSLVITCNLLDFSGNSKRLNSWAHPGVHRHRGRLRQRFPTPTPSRRRSRQPHRGR